MKRVAVVYDTLFTYAGGERILEQILVAFPGCDLHAVIDVLPADQRAWLAGRAVTTSYLQRWPLIRRAFRHYAWAMPAAVEAMDLSGYDLVISCCYAFSNGLLTDRGQKHLSYLVARPLKYVHDDRGSLVRPPFLALKAQIAKDLRQWSAVAARRPDATLAVSNYVRDWHWHRHHVAARTVYPPVDVGFFMDRLHPQPREDYYVTTARLQAYKRLDVLIEAFNTLQKRLVIVGSGPEENRLRQFAGSTVTFAGYRSRADIASIVANARAFVFAANEDFGISMVEAHACGTPVIAYGRAGALEINRSPDGTMLGPLFDTQTPEAVIDAVLAFEAGAPPDPTVLVANAQRFRTDRFLHAMQAAADALF